MVSAFGASSARVVCRLRLVDVWRAGSAERRSGINLAGVCYELHTPGYKLYSSIGFAKFTALVVQIGQCIVLSV